MGQILRTENLAKLQKTSATVVSFGPSIIHAGGQEYETASTLTINTATTGLGGLESAVVANTTYKVWAVIVGSNVSLIAGTGTSPSGYTQYKQVGSFNTDNSSDVEFTYDTSITSTSIGSLSHNAGVVTLSRAKLVFNNTPYVFNNITKTITGLSNYAIYMIYAVLSGGNPTLEFSTNYNSAGPAGYTDWKLVGAFFTNASGAFDVFINIEGTPITKWTDYTPTSSTWTNGNVIFTGKWRCVADSMEVMFSGGCVGFPDNASFEVDIPGGRTIDTNKLPTTVGGRLALGSGTVLDSGTRGYPVNFYYSDTNSIRAYCAETTGAPTSEVTKDNPIAFFANDGLGGKFVVPIAEWADFTKPLKDL